MLLTGEDYLDSIRDGRRVYVGSELVEDVTAHPAFRNAAHSFAMIYDRKRAAENRDIMTVDEDGDTFSTYYLLPRTREDLQRRFETHRRIASWTYGLLGRSPDNFPSYVSGLVMDPAMFDASARVSATTSAITIGICARTICSCRTPSPIRKAGAPARRRAVRRGPADAACRRRGRQRRHHQRIEDARHRLGVLPRDVVRQPPAGRRGTRRRSRSPARCRSTRRE